MRRRLFTSEHEEFREAFRTFVEREMVPHASDWERDGIVPRSLFQTAGAAGFLGLAVPREYGGAEVDDFRFNVVMQEEYQRAGVNGPSLGLVLHNDTALPYLLRLSNEEQKRRWLPGVVSGDLVTALAMTEPGAGSDLTGIETAAERVEGGYVVNGGKTFITNGLNGDLVITAVRTGEERHAGISLLVVERGMPGFERGRPLPKIGIHAQDTAELFFKNVFVPQANLLGEEGEGFRYLVGNLPQERLSIAATAIAAGRRTLEWTLEYVRERKAFGQPIGTFQNSRFVLAELATAIEVGQEYFDRCVEALNAGELTREEAAMAKLYCTELQNRVADRCLQLHGGYGYMSELAVARAFVDARVTTIYGGTSEVMKEIIGRSMGL